MSEIKILGIAGSLRKDSYNKKLLNYTLNLLPNGVSMEIFEGLGEIPLFNQDQENNPPQIVKEFKKKIREADALLIATPEYNRSIPGVLKNAIDWASRPYNDNAFSGKIAAIISASMGMLGGSLAQYHLRQILSFLNVIVVPAPEVFVSFAQQKFDEKGNLTDEMAKKLISQLISNLVNQVKTYKSIQTIRV